MADPKDHFGLPPTPCGSESAKQRLFRQAEARQKGQAILGWLFALLKIHLGLDEARRLFDSFNQAIRDKRETRGVVDPEWDNRLLELHDMTTSYYDAKSAPRKVAMWIAESKPEKLPNHTDNGIEAVIKHIRRLVIAREQKRAEVAAATTAAEKQLRALQKKNKQDRKALTKFADK